MLAMEMKASGMYVSRGLSFRQAEVYEYYCTECVLKKFSSKRLASCSLAENICFEKTLCTVEP